MTISTDLIALRGRLESDLAALLDRSRRLDAHARESNREVPADWPDRATYREDDEVVAQLDELTRAEVGRLRAALGRLGDGTFGTCARCHAEIDSARLDGVPTSPWCVQCAGDVEEEGTSRHPASER